MLSRKKLLWIIATLSVVWLGLFALLKLGERRLNAPRPVPDGLSTANASGGELPRLWPVPDFSGLTQDGAPFSLQNLSGRVWIANFIFTTCANVCPMMTSRMRLIQRSLTSSGVSFLSISVDPTHDDPPALKAYLQLWHGDPARWTLLHLDPQTLQKTTAALRIAVEPTRDPENPILHSRYFLLFDREGQVRGLYDSEDPDAIQRLMKDALTLDGAAGSPSALTAATPGELSGQALFMSLGCAACHTQPRLAPPLLGILGQSRRFQDGTSGVVDTDYLRTSIASPKQHLVEGYLPIMPSYQDYLDAGEVDALVAYLSLQPGMAPSATAPTLAVDPVCGMDVVVAPGTIQAEVAGHTYYFCAESCRERFVKDPTSFQSKPKVAHP